MNEMINNLRDQVMALPRALQWGLATIAFIVAFLVWDGMIRPYGHRWQAAADRIEQNAADVADARDLVRDLRSNRATITSVGLVEVPAASALTHEALTNAINEVLARHTTRGDSIRSGSDRRFPKRFLDSITRSTKRIEAISAELNFEAKPDAAADIIAELESHPAIECIRTLRMIKSASPRVEVRLTLEAWGIAGEDA